MKTKTLIITITILLSSIILYQQTQIQQLQNTINSLNPENIVRRWLQENYGVSSVDELIQEKLKEYGVRYTGNPFTTGLWSGQLQAENITGMHWYTYRGGSLFNRTDVIAYPEQTASYIIWTDGTNIYAKNCTTGQIEFSGTNASYIIQQAINNLPNGGKIFIKKGIYTIFATINITKGITIEGEAQGDDGTLGQAKLIRQFDGEIFRISGNRITLRNIHLIGRDSDTDWLIECSSTYRYITLTYLTLERNGGGGINLNGSYWITIDHVRTLNLGNYAIYSGSGAPTLYSIKNVVGYQTDGLIYLYACSGFIIENVGTDYFAGMTNDLIYLRGSVGLILGANFEGDETSGMPVDCIEIIDSRLAIIGSRFYYCGDTTSAHFPIHGSTIAKILVSSCVFVNTISYRDFAVDNTSTIKIITTRLEKGGTGYLSENNGVAYGLSDGSYIRHWLVSAPTYVTLTCLNSTYDGVPVIVSWNQQNTNSTHIALHIYWSNGTAITDPVIAVSWRAEYQP